MKVFPGKQQRVIREIRPHILNQWTLIKLTNLLALQISFLCRLFFHRRSRSWWIDNGMEISLSNTKLWSGSRYTRWDYCCKNHSKAHVSTLFWRVNDETNWKRDAGGKMFPHEDPAWRNWQKILLYEKIFLFSASKKHSFTAFAELWSFVSVVNTDWRNRNAPTSPQSTRLKLKKWKNSNSCQMKFFCRRNFSTRFFLFFEKFSLLIKKIICDERDFSRWFLISNFLNFF